MWDGVQKKHFRLELYGIDARYHFAAGPASDRIWAVKSYSDSS